MTNTNCWTFIPKVLRAREMLSSSVNENECDTFMYRKVRVRWKFCNFIHLYISYINLIIKIQWTLECSTKIKNISVSTSTTTRFHFHDMLNLLKWTSFIYLYTIIYINMVNNFIEGIESTISKTLGRYATPIGYAICM